MTFSEKLQFLRKHNGLSQEQVAEKLNVSRQAVSRWELGAIPDMENVIKISNYFDCSLDYLMNDAVDIQLFIHRYVLNTKYTVCRVISWGLYLAGTVIGAICICKPWKFMWTSGICIAVVIYLLMIATSLIAATYYGRR